MALNCSLWERLAMVSQQSISGRQYESSYFHINPTSFPLISFVNTPWSVSFRCAFCSSKLNYPIMEPAWTNKTQQSRLKGCERQCNKNRPNGGNHGESEKKNWHYLRNCKYASYNLWASVEIVICRISVSRLETFKFYMQRKAFTVFSLQLWHENNDG